MKINTESNTVICSYHKKKGPLTDDILPQEKKNLFTKIDFVSNVSDLLHTENKITDDGNLASSSSQDDIKKTLCTQNVNKTISCSKIFLTEVTHKSRPHQV